MPQQLLITLPTEASTWVKLHHPRKANKEVSLWEDVTKMFEGEGENRLRGRRRSYLWEKMHFIGMVSWGGP
jgi:hypothetical protein